MNAPDICLRRSVYTGLRYAGITDDCAWIPANATIADLDLIAERYPKLKLYHSEEIHNFSSTAKESSNHKPHLGGFGWG